VEKALGGEHSIRPGAARRGSHAMADRGHGILPLPNNVARRHRPGRSAEVDRVAIVDWDLHHGNGTQVAFYTS